MDIEQIRANIERLKAEGKIKPDAFGVLANTAFGQALKVAADYEAQQVTRHTLRRLFGHLGPVSPRVFLYGIEPRSEAERITQALVAGRDPRATARDFATVIEHTKVPKIERISMGGRTIWERQSPRLSYLVLNDIDLNQPHDALRLIAKTAVQTMRRVVPVLAQIPGVQIHIGDSRTFGWDLATLERMRRAATVRRYRHHGGQGLPKSERDRYRAARRAYKKGLRARGLPTAGNRIPPTEPVGELPYCWACGKECEVKWEVEDASFDHAYGTEVCYSATGVSDCCEAELRCDPALLFPYVPDPSGYDPYDYDDEPSLYDGWDY